MDDWSKFVGGFGDDGRTIRQALADDPAAAAALQCRRASTTRSSQANVGWPDRGGHAGTAAGGGGQPQQDTARQAAFDLDSISATQLACEHRVGSHGGVQTIFTNMVSGTRKTRTSSRSPGRTTSWDTHGKPRTRSTLCVRRIPERTLQARHRKSIRRAVPRRRTVAARSPRHTTCWARGAPCGPCESRGGTRQVPGTSLPTSQSPLGAMMRANPGNPRSESRGRWHRTRRSQPFVQLPSGGGGR